MADRKLKIVAIEDDADNLYVLRVMLEKAGHSVVGASTAVEGIELVHRDCPDLVLLDLKLPGPFCGQEAITRLKALPNAGALKIIVQTASVCPETELEARSAMADDFLRKPFSRRQLMDAIDRHF